MGEVATPGWYPNPSDATGMRYWDGFAWHDAIPARPGPPPPPLLKPPTNWKGLGVVVGVVVAVLLVGGIAAAMIGPSEDYRSSVIDTCQDAAKKILKDPDSARFDDWTATEVSTSGTQGDRHFSASGTVNAKNGFGGYTGGQPYTCDATVTNDGVIHASARP